MQSLPTVATVTHPTPPNSKKKSTAYNIRDVTGALVAIHIRHDRPDGKRYTWAQPDGTPGLNGTPVTRLPLYGIDRLDSRSVVVVEGERCADALIAAGIPAVGSITGASVTPSEATLADLAGKVIYCWPDHDDVGSMHMVMIASRLRRIASAVVMVTPPPDRPKGWDAADALAEPGGKELALDLIAAADHVTPGATDGPPRSVVNLDDVQPESVEWLWPGRIPRRKLVVLDGDPGLGKSTMMLDLAARISTGADRPDGSPGDGPAGVVILSAEDGLGDTIRPRLEAAGADLQRIVALTAVGDDERPVSLPGDVDALEATVREAGARLVIIDPLMAYLGDRVEANRDHSIRRALAPLAAMAERTGAAVVVIRHLNKGVGSALYRGGGSIGVSGAARAVLLVAADPDDDSRRILAVVKSNLAKEPRALAFRLVDDENLGVARIEWLGVTDHRADDLVSTSEEDVRAARRDEAVELLREQLSKGPVPATEVRRLARQSDIADRTLKRAKRDAGVISTRSGFGKGSVVRWSLPDPIEGQPPIHADVAPYGEGGPLCDDDGSAEHEPDALEVPIEGQPVHRGPHRQVVETWPSMGDTPPQCACGKPKIAAGGGLWSCTNGPGHRALIDHAVRIFGDDPDEEDVDDA